MEQAVDLTWEIPQEWPKISDNLVHLWRIRLDGAENVDDFLWELLSIEERERAERFHFNQHRDRFVRSHGILRAILSQYTGVTAVDLVVEKKAGGKPVLGNQVGMDIRFNLSHSGDWMVLGVSIGHEIGVDVEIAVREIDWEMIAKEYFHPYEMQTIGQIPDINGRLESFFRIWTLKEAYLKALGKGLAGGLTQVQVSLNKELALDFVELPGDEIKTRRWQVFAFQPVSGAFGAVVVERGDRDLLLRRFHWGHFLRWIT